MINILYKSYKLSPVKKTHFLNETIKEGISMIRLIRCNFQNIHLMHREICQSKVHILLAGSTLLVNCKTRYNEIFENDKF